jgi:hypothetical protein
MNNNIAKNELSEISKKYLIIFFLLLITCTLFEPISYSFGSLMIGRGRFSDFFDIITNAAKYPNTGSYCITPWHLLIYKWIQNLGINQNYFFYAYIFSLLFFVNKATKKINHIFKLEGYWVLILILTYPFLFSFWRGNNEILSSTLLLLSILELFFGDKKKSYLFFLMCIFIKPSFIPLGILFLPHINKTFILYLSLFFMGTILLIFGFVTLDENFYHSSLCYANYVKDYIIGDGGTLMNNSLYGFIKFNLYSFYPYAEVLKISNSLYLYLFKYWIFIFTPLAIFFIFKLNGISAIFNIFCAYILLTPVAADYRLAILSIPLVLMFFNNYQRWKWLIVLTLVITLPKHFYWFHLGDHNINVTLNSFLNPLIIMGAMFYSYSLGKKLVHDHSLSLDLKL